MSGNTKGNMNFKSQILGFICMFYSVNVCASYRGNHAYHGNRFTLLYFKNVCMICVYSPMIAQDCEMKVYIQDIFKRGHLECKKIGSLFKDDIKLFKPI